MITRKAIPFAIALFLAGAAVAIGHDLGHDRQSQWQLAARYTARVGYPIFLIAYLASTVARLWPSDSTRSFLATRRQWGLAFAFTHSVHLVALSGYTYLAGTIPKIATLIGGGGAYVILFAMALTSNDASQRRLGDTWKWLHRLGIHWLWFIFAFTYFGRMLIPGRRIEGAIFFGLAIGSLGLRLWAKRRQA